MTAEIFISATKFGRGKNNENIIGDQLWSLIKLAENFARHMTKNRFSATKILVAENAISCSDHLLSAQHQH